MERKEKTVSPLSASQVQTKPGVPNAESGIWRSLGVVSQAQPNGVNHGEEYTPLLRISALPLLKQTRLWLKVESRNPTGSAHDRGMAAVAAAGREAGLHEIRLRATPAAGISLAAWAARAGIAAWIQFTERPTAAVRNESLAYGARLARRLVADGSTEITCDSEEGSLDLPILDIWRAALGKIAFEIADQLGGDLPAVIVVPGDDEVLCFALEQALDELARSSGTSARPIVLRADVTERATAAKWCLHLARTEGIFASPATGACMEATNRIELPGTGSAVILDSIAPKFFSPKFFEDLALARGNEESKLGGLITPR
jgi:threonine synthase